MEKEKRLLRDIKVVNDIENKAGLEIEMEEEPQAKTTNGVF
jgi:hypothetical protein